MVDRASAHLLPHSEVPTAAVPYSAHTRPRAKRSSHQNTSESSRCRLRHCLAAAASLRNSKVVDPRQSSQCFSPTGGGFLPGGVWAICCLSGPLSPSPRHWPHFAEGSPHRIAHTGGRVDWTLNTSILQSAWVTPTICGHLAAVWITQWIVITVALWWVPPPTVGAIADWVVGFHCRIRTEQRCLVGRYVNKDVQVRRPGLQVYRP